MTSNRQYLKLNARFCNSSERGGLPIRLLCLLPHDHVEAGAILVTKDKAGIVIIRLGIYVEGPFEVNSIKSRISCSDQNKIRTADKATYIEFTLSSYSSSN